MSTFAGTLPAEQRPAFLTAVTEAGTLLRTAAGHMNDVIRTRGTRALAEESHAVRNGNLTVEQVEAQILALMEAPGVKRAA